MGLKRYSLGIQYYGHWPEIDEEHDQERGDWVRWDDVDALLARIRAAVDAEREADPAVHHRCDCPFGWCDGSCPTLKARKALDALLADGGG